MDDQTLKKVEIIFSIIALIFVILWGTLVVIPVTEMSGLDPVVALTLIIANPYFWIMIATIIIVLIVYWVRRAKGFKFNTERFVKVLLWGTLAFPIVIGLGILFLSLFGWHGYFTDLAGIIQSLTGPNPVMAYLLGSPFYSINASTQFIAPIIDAITPGLGTAVATAVWPAVLTWFTTGVLIVLFVKSERTALYTGLFLALLAWLFVIIVARLILFPVGVVGDPEFTVICIIMLPNVFVSWFYFGVGVIIGYKVFIRSRGDL